MAAGKNKLCGNAGMFSGGSGFYNKLERVCNKNRLDKS